jgi:hypothetical protein
LTYRAAVVGMGSTKVRNTSAPSGRSELPTGRPQRQRWQIAAIALWRALSHPVLDLLNLLRAQRAVADEFIGWRAWFPGWHHATPGGVCDLREVLPNVAVRQQTERTNLARPMAGGAPLVNDRRDVFRKRWLTRGSGESARAPQQHDQEPGKASNRGRHTVILSHRESRSPTVVGRKLKH